MLKVIVPQIGSEDWFASGVSWWFAFGVPRFAFWCDAYKCWVLPFGQVSLQLTLTKYIEAALASLHPRAAMYSIIQMNGSSWLSQGKWQLGS